MAESKQSVGDISHSGGVRIQQTATQTAEQRVGNVVSSFDIAVVQSALGPNSEVLLEIEELLDLSANAGVLGQSASDLRAALPSSAHGIVVDRFVLGEIAANAVAPAIKSPTLATALRDASAAVSLVSGAIAIGQLGDPYLLALAAPATLAAAGAIGANDLKSLYSRIKGVLRGALDRK